MDYNLYMLYGGHIKDSDHIKLLQALGLDFGEVVFRNKQSLKVWKESQIANPISDDFFLIGHGPSEGPPNDTDRLWNTYYPVLRETVNVASFMKMSFLTIHLWVDRRFVQPIVIHEKTNALGMLVEYGKQKHVKIGLENLSEDVRDLERVVKAVPDVGIVLDVGHGQLITKTNTSIKIIEELGDSIRHIHLHDNNGGKGPKDDLHLPIGKGVVDFSLILGKLVGIGYQGTATLELEPQELPESLEIVKKIVDGIRSNPDSRVKLEEN